MMFWDEALPEPGLHVTCVNERGRCETLCGITPEIGEPTIGVQTAHQFLREAVDCLDCLIIAGQRFPEFGWHPIQFGPYGLPCVFCGHYGDEETLELLSGDEQGCFECVANWLDKLKEDSKR